MRDKKFGVITFKSTSHAMKGESIFKDEDVKFRIIPTPREISHSCGLSIKFNLEDLKLTKDIILRNNMDIDGIFKILRDIHGNHVEKLN